MSQIYRQKRKNKPEIPTRPYYKTQYYIMIFKKRMVLLKIIMIIQGHISIHRRKAKNT